MGQRSTSGSGPHWQNQTCLWTNTDAYDNHVSFFFNSLQIIRTWWCLVVGKKEWKKTKVWRRGSVQTQMLEISEISDIVFCCNLKKKKKAVDCCRCTALWNSCIGAIFSLDVTMAMSCVCVKRVHRGFSLWMMWNCPNEPPVIQFKSEIQREAMTLPPVFSQMEIAVLLSRHPRREMWTTVV